MLQSLCRCGVFSGKMAGWHLRLVISELPGSLTAVQSPRLARSKCPTTTPTKSLEGHLEPRSSGYLQIHDSHLDDILETFISCIELALTMIP